MSAHRGIGTLSGGDALCCGVSADQVVEPVGGAR